MYKLGDIINGQYAVAHVFTNGGMGVVYKVRHLSWDMDMAMKCPRSELFENIDQRNGFVKECETWMDLGSHPNIISCYYIKLIDSIPAVLMEYADGGSLLDCISSGQLYNGTPKDVLKRIMDYAIQTARGLLHAHQKGYVHQDVKPANVLLMESGIVKVSDFGLSKAKGLLPKSKLESFGRSMIVSSGGWTPAYGSPEQALGLPLTRRTDVWSWAVMVLEMIHGEMFWETGPFAARALRKLWPWQIFSPKVQSSSGLMKILRECLEEQEEKRPRDFDIIIEKLTALYKELFKDEYSRQLPSSVLMTETTLCNRIASYAELEGCGRDYFREAYDSLSELRKISPWSIWGELNYVVYMHAHGTPIETIRRVIENMLRRTNTDQEKEWLLDLLLTFGLATVRDRMVGLLRIDNNTRLLERVKRVHESMRDRLIEVFCNEKIRHPVIEDFDFDRHNSIDGVSENSTARVWVKRKSKERNCSVTVIVKIVGKEYVATDDCLPGDARIEYVTIDDNGIKVSLWIWVPQLGFYQKVFGLKNGELVSYRCDFRKKEDWGVDVWDIPLGVYISGDARITMLRYKHGVCSLWLNECRDISDGRNICIIRLSDFGLIPPETILPKLRLECGFEYGLSNETAYRLMKMLSQVYGNMRIPCYISRPESSNSEMKRSYECSRHLFQVDQAYESGDQALLITAVSHCLKSGILPSEKCLSVRHQMVLGEPDVFLKRCWHSLSIDEYWEHPIYALFSVGSDEYQLVSLGLCPRQLVLNGNDHGVKRFSWEVNPELVMDGAADPSYIALSACNDGDIIIASCDGWHVQNIYRVKKDQNAGQLIVWKCQVPANVRRIELVKAWQTNRTIAFQSSKNRFVRIDKSNGEVFEVRTSGAVRLWFDNFSTGSLFSEMLVVDSQLTAIDKYGKIGQVPDFVKIACSRGQICGISHDARRLLVCGNWNVSICDMFSGDSQEVYVVDPFDINQYGYSGSSVMLCALSPNGLAVAILTIDRRLKVFDTVNCIDVFEWKLDDGKYGPMQFDCSGRWLTIVRDEKKLEVFQLFWENL